MVEWSDSDARKASNCREPRPPSWSRCKTRTLGRGMALPWSSTGVPTRALNLAMTSLVASTISDLSRKNMTNTNRECSSVKKAAYLNLPTVNGEGKGPLKIDV